MWEWIRNTFFNRQGSYQFSWNLMNQFVSLYVPFVEAGAGGGAVGGASAVPPGSGGTAPPQMEDPPMGGTTYKERTANRPSDRHVCISVSCWEVSGEPEWHKIPDHVQGAEEIQEYLADLGFSTYVISPDRGPSAGEHFIGGVGPYASDAENSAIRTLLSIDLCPSGGCDRSGGSTRPTSRPSTSVGRPTSRPSTSRPSTTPTTRPPTTTPRQPPLLPPPTTIPPEYSFSQHKRVCVREINQGNGQIVPIDTVAQGVTCPAGTRVLNLCKNPSDFQPSSYVFMSYWYENVYLPNKTDNANKGVKLILALPDENTNAHADAPDWCKFVTADNLKPPPPCPPTPPPSCPGCDSSSYRCEYNDPCSTFDSFSWESILGADWMNNCE